MLLITGTYLLQFMQEHAAAERLARTPANAGHAQDNVQEKAIHRGAHEGACTQRSSPSSRPML